MYSKLGDSENFVITSNNDHHLCSKSFFDAVGASIVNYKLLCQMDVMRKKVTA